MRILLVFLGSLILPAPAWGDPVILLDVGVMQGTLETPVFVSLSQNPGATVSPYLYDPGLNFSAHLISSASVPVTLVFEWTLQGVTTTLVFPFNIQAQVPTYPMAPFTLPGECCYHGVDGTLHLTLNGLTTANYSFHVLTPAPEPGTLLLLGSALAGLGWWRRRTR